MIVARDLSKRFGKVVAVDSINFRIPPGRVVGFLGPNGAGKTTTIRMIAGYLRPSGGSVTVDGLDATTTPREIARRIGYMPESTPLYPEMRVVEYLWFRARLFGVKRGQRRSRIDGAMGKCGLWDVRRRRIGSLSRGYRQRVGLAAVLLHDPPVLILDEPMAGLDPAQIRDVRGLVRELAGQHTILFSTHILPEAELACDDLIMIAAGRVLAEGSVEKLRTTLAPDGRYVVETDSGAAEGVLASLPSIAHVEATALADGWIRLLITPSSTADDRRELISRTLRKMSAPVRELRRESPTLEQMFIRMLSGTNPQRNPAPPRPTPPEPERRRPVMTPAAPSELEKTP